MQAALDLSEDKAIALQRTGHHAPVQSSTAVDGRAAAGEVADGVESRKGDVMPELATLAASVLGTTVPADAPLMEASNHSLVTLALSRRGCAAVTCNS